MIKNIIELLQFAKGETENIQIAQGKYALPKDINSGFKLIKKTLQWK
jgi:hypothetical protein